MAGHQNPDKPTDTNPGSDRDGAKPTRHGGGEPFPTPSQDGQKP